MLITPEYREQNRALHDANPAYGTSGHKWAETIDDLATSMKTRDVLDYGCGKQTLKQKLPYVRGYDPCIAGLDSPPEPADLVVCGDVLEHIEPGCIDAVLDDLRRVTKGALFAVVATRAAKKTLPDGRNAHLIQQPPQWWLPKFFERFHVNTYSDMGGEFIVIASTVPA